MLSDGRINSTLWADFAGRAVHEMTVKVKALITAVYGEPPRFSYFEGFSTGGREGFALAQRYPEDFNGILAFDAPIYWTRVMTGPLVYPRVVVHEDLADRYPSDAQLRLVSSAATSACDTTVVPSHHDGFISDPAVCHYDPTRDPSVLCRASGGDNATPSCVSSRQARAIDKIWFGETRDGRAPDPAVDNGFHPDLSHNQLWFGVSRGIDITKTAGAAVFTANGIWQVALSLQSPRLGDPRFHNATGNGTNGWKSLSYGDLSHAQSEGLRLQSAFGGINAASTDLSRFAADGGKILYTHGMADAFFVVQGSDHYYTAVARKMGGFARVQKFFRYYPIPGGSHEGVPGPVPGIPGVSPAPDPPLPSEQQLYKLLQEWVEEGRAPGSILIHNSNGTLNRPLCMYPRRIRYIGGGIESADSYRCC
jgi:feruloyl esterase